VSFHRPGPNQYYWGLIDKNLENINGEFSHPGVTNFFAFDATKAPTSIPYTPPKPVTADSSIYWTILSNGYPGQLNFGTLQSTNILLQYTSSGGTIQYYQGPLNNHGGVNPTETINSVSFSYHYGQWYVNFYRPNANQWYYGMFDCRGRNIHGHFIAGQNYPIYPFDATLSYTESFAVSDVVLGRYTDLANSWAGALELTSQQSGVVAFDNAPYVNPAGVSNPLETLQNLTIPALMNGIYINYYRPGPAQWYYGLFERDLTNIHGSFTQGYGTYEFDATSTVYTYSPL